MEKPTADPRRRRALRLAAATAVSIPLTGLAALAAAIAEELPPLSEDDRSAQALGYVHDAARAPAGKRRGGAVCGNCNLIRGETGTWRGCAIFPGKAVNANGWCAGWVGRV